MSCVPYWVVSDILASFSVRRNFLAEFQINSSRYDLVFSLLIFPPVAWDTPANIFSPSCVYFIGSYVMALEEEDICMMVESSSTQ